MMEACILAINDDVIKGCIGKDISVMHLIC